MTQAHDDRPTAGAVPDPATPSDPAASPAPGGPSVPRRLYLLTFFLFIAYLCVAMALPVVPIFVTGTLGMNNALAGLAVGVVFLSTILSRGPAGSFSDRRGAKPAALTGLGFYLAGAVISLGAGLLVGLPWLAYAVLLAGRAVIGIGESLVAIAIIGWGIGLVGPARSGRVMSLVGAAMYGGYAAGGPVGLWAFGATGFAGTMALAALLPLLALLVLRAQPGVPLPPAAPRQSFLKVLGMIRAHGAILGLQGIGFAAISAFFSLYFLHNGWQGAGLGLAAFGVGFVAMRFLFGGLPDRIGGLNVAIGSLAIEVVGQALLWLTPTPELALLGALLSGVGCSLIYPAMGREVVGIVPAHLRGTALGGFSAFQDLAYGFTGPLAGLLADRAGYDSVFLVGTVAAATGLGVALSLRRRRG